MCQRSGSVAIKKRSAQLTILLCIEIPFKCDKYFNISCKLCGASGADECLVSGSFKCEHTHTHIKWPARPQFVRSFFCPSLLCVRRFHHRQLRSILGPCARVRALCPLYAAWARQMLLLCIFNTIPSLYTHRILNRIWHVIVSAHL